MIKELTWDSQFFKRKIGELRITSQTQFKLKEAVTKARSDGFEYIICKPEVHQTALFKALEATGFYLSDIGVTWSIDSGILFKPNSLSNSVKPAFDSDIGMLQEIVKSLFLESRFYSDPFFSKDDADRLFKTWVENSVKGVAADIVLHIPQKGFVTCKKTAVGQGAISLIGVSKRFRNKSIGMTLSTAAVHWFRTQGVDAVSVRTQLKNLNAMNFYRKLGFHIKEYDFVLANIL